MTPNNTPIPYRQALLMKRMAWRMMNPPTTPSASDQRFAPIAVRMLTYIACLDYALLDLEQELTDASLFRHLVKKNVRIAIDRAQRVHGIAYQMLHRVSSSTSRQYNTEMDNAYSAILKAVLLPSPEKAYNIVVATCRLIEQLNGRISCRYNFAPAHDLYRLPSLLSVAGIKDYGIDRIIELSTTNNE